MGEGIVRKFGIYTLLYLKWIINKDLLYNMELCSMLYGSLDGRGVWGQNVLCLVTQSCPTLCYSNDCSPPGSSVHRDSPGKSTGVGCHALLQEIFPTQGSNPGLLQGRQILYHLSHQQSHTTSQIENVGNLTRQIYFYQQVEEIGI